MVVSTGINKISFTGSVATGLFISSRAGMKKLTMELGGNDPLVILEDADIETGKFDNVADCGYSVPSYWDIAKVYRRLIKMVADEKKLEIINALIEVYTSFISSKIDDYNSSFYYENPGYIFECYNAKMML